MTTTALPSVRDHAASHNAQGCCWLCALEHEDKSWWRDLRIRKGYSAVPPYRTARLIQRQKGCRKW